MGMAKRISGLGKSMEPWPVRPAPLTPKRRSSNPPPTPCAWSILFLLFVRPCRWQQFQFNSISVILPVIITATVTIVVVTITHDHYNGSRTVHIPPYCLYQIGHVLDEANDMTVVVVVILLLRTCFAAAVVTMFETKLFSHVHQSAAISAV
jgi:hypothetical protein